MDALIEQYRRWLRKSSDARLELRMAQNKEWQREGYKPRGLQPSEKIREIEAEIARRSGLDSSPASVDLAGLIWEVRDAAIG